MIRAFLLTALSFFFLTSSGVQAASDIPLVISEIQKSIEKTYKVKFPDQNPLPPGPAPIPDKPVVKPTPAPKPVVKPTPKKITKKKRGLLEDDEDFVKYTGPKKLKFKRSGKNLSIKERLAQRRAENANKSNSKLDAIRAKRQAEIDAKRPKARSDVAPDANARWETRKKKELKKWETNKLKILARWKKAAKKYKKEIPAIKKDLTEIPFGSAPVKVSTKKPKKDYRPKSEPLVHVASTAPDNPLELNFIEEAFKVPVRNQGRRPTCAAFAAVRAIEIISHAIGEKNDYSEQWFYYASKPDCQNRPCNRPGSWPRKAMLNSKRGNQFDIPLEKSCPYKETKSPGNETQIPLNNSCKRGKAKVGNFSMVTNRHEIQQRIRSGQPVIAGFKLSEDFFLNTGFVFDDPKAKMGKGIHAQGHAILLVGVMELPKALHSTQGKYCTLIANSWGEGWGRGGHACISDRWFDRYRYDMAFIALESVSVN